MSIILDGTTGITTPDLIDSSLTSGRVVYAGTSGNLTGSSTFVFDGTNLGVGGSPANVINAKSATQYKGVQVNNATNVIAELIGFDASNESGGLKLYSSTSPKVQFLSNGDSFLTGGNFGIGTLTPATKLAVAGGIAGTAGLNISGGGWGVLPYVSNSLVIDNNAGQTRFFAAGDASNFGTYIWYGGKTTGAATGVLALEVGKSLALEGASSQSGTGITFPATQSASSNANTLDDYEEGTFTATLTCTTSGTITLGYNTLYYTKIGRQITILGYLSVNSVSSPVGNVQLNGLPFTVLGGNIARPVLNIRADGLTTGATTSIIGELSENTTAGTIFKYSAGSVAALAGNVQAGSNLVVSATYFTS